MEKTKKVNKGAEVATHSSAVSISNVNKKSTTNSEKRRRRRRRRTIRKTLLHVGPCGALLFVCWLIIQLQKRQIMHDDMQKSLMTDDMVDTIGERGGSSTAAATSGSNVYTDTTNNTYSLSSSSSDIINRYPFNGLSDIAQSINHDNYSKDETRSTASTTALFWQIPRTGGTTLKYILGSCLNLVQASRMSADYCDVEDPNLHVCQTNNLGPYVNADTSDDHGIQRAQELKLVPSGLVDVIVSSRFLHVVALFDVDHKGRVFTVVRDPVDRIVSTFYYLQNANWERTYNDKYKDMTLMEYIQSDDVATNWMVRWLVGKPTDKLLTEQDLELAKDILRRKVLILLTEEMSTSIDRLIRFMGWDVDEEGRKCLDENTSKVGGHNINLHREIDVGSEEYSLMREKNRFDVELYNFALGLFTEQWKLIP